MLDAATEVCLFDSQGVSDNIRTIILDFTIAQSAMNVLHFMYPFTLRSKHRVSNQHSNKNFEAMPRNERSAPHRISVEIETSTLSIADYYMGNHPQTDISDVAETESVSTEHATLINDTIDSANTYSTRVHYRGETATEPVDLDDIFAAIQTGWSIPTMPSAKTKINRTPVAVDEVVCVPPTISPAQEQRILSNLLSVSVYSLREQYRELKPAYIPIDDNRSTPLPPLIFRPHTADSDQTTGPRRPVPLDFRVPAERINSQSASKIANWSCLPVATSCFTREPRHASTTRHFDGVKVDLVYYAHKETDAIILALDDTPFKVGIGFHGYCAERIGDFMVGGYFRSLRGIHLFMLMKRGTSSQPSTFRGPRLLAVPREFVENAEKVLPAGDGEENHLINVEWCHIFRGSLLDRIDELLNAGLGCFM